jgi:hypothetical protein
LSQRFQYIKKLVTAAVLILVTSLITVMLVMKDPVGIRWTPRVKAYRITSSLETQFFMDETLLPLMMVDITADVLFNVFDSKSLPIHAGFRIDNVSAEVGGEEARDMARVYEGEFLVDLTPEGEMIRFAFPESYPAEKTELMTGFVKQFEVIIVDDKKNYDIRQTDGTGEYLASYNVSNPASAVKTKKNYLTVESTESFGQGLAAEVLESDIRFDIRDSDCWLSDAKGMERLSMIWPNGQPMAEVRNTFEMVAVERTPEQAGAGWQSKSYDDMLSAFHDGKKAAALNQRPPVPESHEEPADLEALQDVLWDQLAGLGPKGPISDSDRFKTFLAAHPDLVRTIPELIKGGTLPEKHAMLIGILGIIQTDEAQAALGNILSDHGQTGKNRARAAVAFGSITDVPTEESLNTLTGVLDDIHADNPENEIPGAALFSLGRISRNLHERGIPAAEELDDTMASMLDSSANNDQRYYILGALGNTFRKELAPVIAPYLDDENAMVRGAAAEALRGMDTPEARSLLLESLKRETASSVRNHLIDSLTQMTLPERQVGEVANMALDEKDPIVRRRLIDFIGIKGAVIADRAGLIDRLIDRETSKNNIKALLRIKSSDKETTMR